MSSYTVYTFYMHILISISYSPWSHLNPISPSPHSGEVLNFKFDFYFLHNSTCLVDHKLNFTNLPLARMASLHSPQPVAPSSTSHCLPWPYRDVNSTTHKHDALPHQRPVILIHFYNFSTPSLSQPLSWSILPAGTTILTIQCPPPCPTTTFTLPGAQLWWTNSPDSTLRI